MVKNKNKLLEPQFVGIFEFPTIGHLRNMMDLGVPKSILAGGVSTQPGASWKVKVMVTYATLFQGAS